jgi:predicted RecB family endonuclease
VTRRAAFLWNATEDETQAAIVQALRIAFPRLVVAAIPNGGSRHIAEAAKMHGTGTVAGMPDLVVVLPDGRVDFIEVKAAGGRLSAAQTAIIHSLTDLGHPVAVCRDIHEAHSFVKDQLARAAA